MTQPISLNRLLLAALNRHRWLLLISLLCLASALAVVLASHQARELIGQREELRAVADELDIEWRNLLLEQSALGDHSRVEQLARKQGMFRPSPKEEQVVKLP